jgi:hypothetical protein
MEHRPALRSANHIRGGECASADLGNDGSQRHALDAGALVTLLAASCGWWKPTSLKLTPNVRFGSKAEQLKPSISRPVCLQQRTYAPAQPGAYLTRPVSRDDEQAPYEAGPLISPLHS